MMVKILISNLKNKCVAQFILAIVCIFPVQILASSPHKIFIVKDGKFVQRQLRATEADRFGIYLYDQAKNSFVRFAPEYRGINPQISPKGTYISFFGTDNKKTIMFNSNGRWNKQLKLHLFTINGKHVKSFALPQGSIVWSPDEDKIVFTESAYEEMRNHENNNLWLLDFKSEGQTKIPDKGSSVTWQKFDKKIYFVSSDRHKIVSYDVQTKEIKETQYNGVNFSDDGKYYFYYESEDSDIRIYLAGSNENITAGLLSNIQKNVSVTPNSSTMRWDVLNNLVFADYDIKKWFVFDPRKMIILNSYEGYYVDIIDTVSKEALVIEKGKPVVKKANHRNP